MKPDANSAEVEARLRRVRPVVPSDALRQRALARAREAWRETPAAARGPGAPTTASASSDESAVGPNSDWDIVGPRPESAVGPNSDWDILASRPNGLGTHLGGRRQKPGRGNQRHACPWAYVPWMAAAAVLVLGLFVNRLLVADGDRPPGAVAAPASVAGDGLDELRGALGRCLFGPQPAADTTIDDFLREREVQLRSLQQDSSPGTPAPPVGVPQAGGDRSGVDRTAGAARPMGWTV